jgi:hypothetical protein
MEVMLVLFDGLGSTKVELVTVAELWIVVPAAVPFATRIVMVRAVVAAPLARAAL